MMNVKVSWHNVKVRNALALAQEREGRGGREKREHREEQRREKSRGKRSFWTEVVFVIFKSPEVT